MKKKFTIIMSLVSTCIFIIPVSLHGIVRRPLRRSLDEKYELALNQLQKHLDEIKLTYDEKNDLIDKIKEYFSKPSKIRITLQNPAAQLIYATITKSYNEFLTLQNKGFDKSSNKAQLFAEKSLEKLNAYTVPHNAAPSKNSKLGQ